MRRGHKCSLPHLIISLYNQLAQNLKIGDLECTESDPVCDFDTIWAVAAAIIVQLDALLLSCTLDIVQLQKCDCVMLMAFNNNYHNRSRKLLCGYAHSCTHVHLLTCTSHACCCIHAL